MGITDGCHDARNMVSIKEMPCPKCGCPVEVFIKDGRRFIDSVCGKCGFVLPEEEIEDESAE